MKKRLLGKTGLEVSVVGFGGIPIQGLSDSEAERVVKTALDEGINFIDSARGYTDSEVKIGKSIGVWRDRVILATKTMVRTAEAMEQDIEASLKNFRTDYIDLYQLHNVANDEQFDQVMADDGAYRALERAQKAGKVRHIGVTSHSQPTMVKLLQTGMFATAQLPFNYIENHWRDQAIPTARQHNVGLIGMKPVAGGAFMNVPAALRYALTHGVDAVIPGMDTIEQVRENAAVGAGLLEPTEDDVQKLDAEKQVWTGHFCRRCGYCKPCKEGLEIPFLFVIEAYYTRYNLKAWALDRLAALKKQYGDCTACGECVSRCPYDLPIPDLMEKYSKIVV